MGDILKVFKICPLCTGRRVIDVTEDSPEPNGHGEVVTQTCPRCNGEGEIIWGRLEEAGPPT